MKLLVFFFMLFFNYSVLAETSLWQVTKQGKHLYLGGTVHLLAKKDLPFPAAFDKAYNIADSLVFETDLVFLSDPQMQMKLLSLLSYQDGRLLSQVISIDLYEKLNQYLKTRGLMPNMFISMKPAGVMLTLLAIEFKRLGISQSGADFYYYQKALTDGKYVMALESIDAHFRFITSMGEGYEEQFLRQTLTGVNQTEVMMDTIVAHWKNGDISGLERDVIQDIRLNYPQMYQSLLVQRNLQWLPKIESMLDTEEIEFVLVGAAHLIGTDGILNALSKQGYQITQQ